MKEENCYPDLRLFGIQSRKGSGGEVKRVVEGKERTKTKTIVSPKEGSARRRFLLKSNEEESEGQRKVRWFWPSPDWMHNLIREPLLERSLLSKVSLLANRRNSTTAPCFPKFMGYPLCPACLRTMIFTHSSKMTAIPSSCG